MRGTHSTSKQNKLLFPTYAPCSSNTTGNREQKQTERDGGALSFMIFRFPSLLSPCSRSGYPPSIFFLLCSSSPNLYLRFVHCTRFNSSHQFSYSGPPFPSVQNENTRSATWPEKPHLFPSLLGSSDLRRARERERERWEPKVWTKRAKTNQFYFFSSLR